MDVLDAIRHRRAVREYRADPVPTSLLRELVEAASWAPSAMNGQSWRFVVVTNGELLNNISQNSKRWVLNNQPSLVGNEQMRSLLNNPQYQVLHNAPALIAIATPIDTRWNAEGCALAAENVMLAATALGLGSCWIGLAEDWLNTSECLKALGLAETDRIIAPIIVGYPRGLLQPVTRNQPNIWIGAGEKLIEDGGHGELPAKPGFYGSLIHP